MINRHLINSMCTVCGRIVSIAWGISIPNVGKTCREWGKTVYLVGEDRVPGRGVGVYSLWGKRVLSVGIAEPLRGTRLANVYPVR